jgi:UPF0716 protein FxsA
MVRWIGLLAIALPFLEIAGFVVIGGRLGLPLTLLWVLAAMVGGLLLLRRTGLQAVGKLRAAIETGTEPGSTMLDAACFAAAAMLLIIPGFFSDALAGLLMLPATRHWLLRRTASHFEGKVYRRSGVIAGEFTVVGEEEHEPDVQPPRQIGTGSNKSGPQRPIIDVE